MDGFAIQLALRDPAVTPELVKGHCMALVEERLDWRESLMGAEGMFEGPLRRREPRRREAGFEPACKSWVFSGRAPHRGPHAAARIARAEASRGKDTASTISGSGSNSGWVVLDARPQFVTALDPGLTGQSV